MRKNADRTIMSLALAAFTVAAFCLPPQAVAADVSRFLKPKAWQCTFSASLNRDVTEATGPAGNSPMNQLLKSFSGDKASNPGGDTDSYHQTVEQTVKGQIRLHYVYDGGEDGIQIAGWGNGGAQVYHVSHFNGTEQNKTIIRDKTTTYDGPAKFEGEEYEPPFNLWIDPAAGAYSIEYGLSPVTGRQVEHCRMAEGMEADRKKAESATDADMPLGGFFSGLTKFTCPTEKITDVTIENGAFAAMRENIPLPAAGLVLAGQGESQYTDGKGVMFQWSCRPE